MLSQNIEVTNAFDSFLSSTPNIVSQSVKENDSGASTSLELSVDKCEVAFSFIFWVVKHSVLIEHSLIQNVVRQTHVINLPTLLDILHLSLIQH